jgi:hypothetical protein
MGERRNLFRLQIKGSSGWLLKAGYLPINRPLPSGAWWPWVFSDVVLLAYIWSIPFRDLYGLEVRNALMAGEMLERSLSMVAYSVKPKSFVTSRRNSVISVAMKRSA